MSCEYDWKVDLNAFYRLALVIMISRESAIIVPQLVLFWVLHHYAMYPAKAKVETMKEGSHFGQDPKFGIGSYTEFPNEYTCIHVNNHIISCWSVSTSSE